MRPRLADAAFFWEQDRKKSARRARAGDRCATSCITASSTSAAFSTSRAHRRVLAGWIARGSAPTDATSVARALLAKCDLVTDMVGEFPELQGTMGRYYAEHDGLPGDIASALEEQYLPRFAGDALARIAGGPGTGARRQARHAGGHLFASARSPAATRIRSACGAPRWASCASSSSAARRRPAGDARAAPLPRLQRRGRASRRADALPQLYAFITTGCAVIT